MNSSKGQITLFFVIGVALILVVGLLFTFSLKSKIIDSDNVILTTKSFENDVKHYKVLANSCFEDAAVSSLWDLGRLGGYFPSLESSMSKHMWIPDITIISGSVNLADYSLLTNFPSYSDFENNLCVRLYSEFSQCLINYESDLFDVEIPFSINDFSNKFNHTSCDIDLSGRDKNGLSKDDISKVEINLNYPIKISKEAMSEQINKFSTVLEVSFSSYYNTIKRIYDQGGVGECGRHYYDDYVLPKPEEKALYLKTTETNIFTTSEDVRIIDYSFFEDSRFKSAFIFMMKGSFVSGNCPE